MSKSSSSSLCILESNLLFTALIFLAASLIYSNTLQGGYVWDDRAAILGNPDVHGTNSIFQLLRNDFWGQNLHLVDSHKSYRPLTVLTYRLNYFFHGLEPWSYHVGNVFIYACTCIAYYWFAKQWLSKGAVQVSALLFVVHPVHVEAVASIVGRADSLCGLLYLLSMVLYTKSIRHSANSATLHTSSKNAKKISKLSQIDIAKTSLAAASYVCALCACLAKEIGVTVFGMLCILEVADSTLKVLVKNAPKFVAGEKVAKRDFRSEQRLEKGHKGRLGFKGALGDIVERCPGAIVDCIEGLFACFSTRNLSALARMLTNIVLLALVGCLRVYINGKHKIYQWTVMENHISLLPNFSERAMSYGHTHFWYLAKLIFPRYLSFDYGYACIPTIHTVFDIRNALTLLGYAAVLSVAVQAIRGCRGHARVSLLVGFALMLLPLVPALNILFPVGTVLAERLLFIPSMGFSMIATELLIVDCAFVWSALAAASSKWLNMIFPITQTSGGAVEQTLAQKKKKKQPSKLSERAQNSGNRAIGFRPAVTKDELHSSLNQQNIGTPPRKPRQTTNSPESAPSRLSISSDELHSINSTASGALDSGNSSTHTDTCSVSSGLSEDDYLVSEGVLNEVSTSLSRELTRTRSESCDSMSKKVTFAKADLLKDPFAKEGFLDNTGSVSAQNNRNPEKISQAGTSKICKPATITHLIAEGQSSRQQQKIHSKRQWSLFLVCLLPILGVGIHRVMTRNEEWNSEIEVFKSGLQVCPLSVKALSNYASLALGYSDNVNALVAAETAISLHSTHIAAYVNAGLALHRLGQYAKSVQYFEKALGINGNHAKAHFYMGQALYDWSNGIAPIDSATTALDEKKILRERSFDALRRATELGAATPVCLHTAGSVLMDLDRFAEAIQYLEASLTQELPKQGVTDASNPETGKIDSPRTYNQLGNAFAALDRLPDARHAYESALKVDPGMIAIYVNLGTLLHKMGDTPAARRTMKKGISKSKAKGTEVPVALLNNLGLLELDEGRPEEGLRLFEEAQRQVSSGRGMDDMRAVGQSSILQVLQGNIERAQLEINMGKERN